MTQTDAVGGAAAGQLGQQPMRLDQVQPRFLHSFDGLQAFVGLGHAHQGGDDRLGAGVLRLGLRAAQLGDALGDFVAQGDDLKHLVRTIATSRAYDRSSLPNEWNRDDRQNFARAYPRRLPAEVLLDAIGAVSGAPVTFNGLPKSLRAVELPDEASDTSDKFLEVFGRPKRASVCECERIAEANLSQGLHLLNSAELQETLHSKSGRAAHWANDPRPDAEKVDELYRRAYSRPPTSEERAVCLSHLARRRANGKLREGYEDLIWTLVNTKEFLFNR